MTRKNAEILLSYIKRLNVEHTPWEEKFIVHLHSKFSRGYSNITHGEAAKLQELYGKCSGGGMYENKKYI